MGKGEALKREYPLHWAVFRRDYEELLELLEDAAVTDINKLDVRGRTPLMLAVTLGHSECARALLEKGADATVQNADMWSLSHEAICSGNGDLLKLILQYRDFQRAVSLNRAMEHLLKLLKETSDFYAEMSWEFSSWLPFVSKMCPSDTYRIACSPICFDWYIISGYADPSAVTAQNGLCTRVHRERVPVFGNKLNSFSIYKRGSDVRIDTTLVGFDSASTWKRGNQSFIFRFTADNQIQFIIVDHDLKTVNTRIYSSNTEERLEDFEPPDDAVYSRMIAPVETTFVDIDKIGFERSKAGGLRSWFSSYDGFDEVNGYQCKVFTASNVEMITKRRVEHLHEEDKERFKQEESNDSLSKVLRLVEKTEEYTAEMKRTGNDVYCGLTPAQYLDKDFSMENRDIGHPKQVTRKCNSFKATLWLSDEFPLSLQEQILPIVDLMAVSNAHFARLKNFIQLQLPAGFPVKIEIPLFHLVSARITFSNVNKPGPHVLIKEPENTIIFEAKTFDIPEHYCSIEEGFGGSYENSSRYTAANGYVSERRYIPEDELYLQFALEQSMREAAGLVPSNDSGIPLSVYNNAQSEMDPALALAIAESLRSLQLETGQDLASASSSNMDEELNRVLQLSKKEEEERARLQREQDEELERVLALSLIEK